jgi:hypothetical protein
MVLAFIAYVGLSASQKANSATTPGVTSPTIPPATIATARQIPIPGLTAADIKLNLQGKDFSCTNVHVGETLLDWSCKHKVGSLVEYSVIYYGETPMSICSVDATVLQYGSPDDVVASSFLAILPPCPMTALRRREPGNGWRKPCRPFVRQAM